MKMTTVTTAVTIFSSFAGSQYVRVRWKPLIIKCHRPPHKKKSRGTIKIASSRTAITTIYNNRDQQLLQYQLSSPSISTAPSPAGWCTNMLCLDQGGVETLRWSFHSLRGGVKVRWYRGGGWRCLRDPNNSHQNSTRKVAHKSPVFCKY